MGLDGRHLGEGHPGQGHISVPPKELAGGGNGQVEDGTGRQDRGASHAVVSQVGVALQIDLTGPVHSAIADRGADDGLKDRVSCGARAGALRLVFDPVALPAPCVGGQVGDRAAHGELARPVDRKACAVQSAERLQH